MIPKQPSPKYVNTNNMQNEKYTDLIDKAFKGYADSHWTPGDPNGTLLSEQLASVRPMMHNRESFESEARSNQGFAKEWGLTFETRDLTWEETTGWVMRYTDVELENLYIVEEAHKETTPNKLTTVTYGNQTVSIYERG